MRIGLVTFGLPPEYNRKIPGNSGESELDKLLGQTPHDIVPVYIHTAGELSAGLTELRSQGADCLIVALSHWTRISLVVNLVRSAGLPTALYARTTGGLNGITALTAASAGLREISHSKTADLHARFRDGASEEIGEWIRGMAAYTSLRASRVMCWGGGYGANMPYTRSDPDFLESTLVAEVMTEQEVVLTDKAERILAGEIGRTDSFLAWTASQGMKIDYRDSMCTPDAVRRQVALYLAARERLSELKDENIRGVSIKCHFELSTTNWGCTACMLPAFLPFPQGPHGSEDVLPVACEGDLNGLVSLMMLHAANPEVPPLFGDFVEYNDDYTLLRNCGSSSVYWAGGSNNPAESLAKTQLLPNMHGKSGAAVHYETPDLGLVTACRLFRLRGEFRVIMATGQVIGETERTRYADPWPHTRIDFGVDSSLLFQVYPCNHSSVSRGDLTGQIRWLCRMAGVPCHVIGSNDDAQNLLETIYTA